MADIQFTFQVDDGDLFRAGEASSQMKLALKRLGLPQDVIRRVSICLYEGEINMVIHANGGTIYVGVGMEAITLRLEDRGPGIPDVEQAMEQGFSTASAAARSMGFGAGMGLPNMHRHADEFHIDTKLNQGTTLTMKIYINAEDHSL